MTPRAKYGLSICLLLLLGVCSAARPGDMLRQGRSLLQDDGSGCDQGAVDELLPWEQKLIEDFPNTSTWGRLCFDTTQGAVDTYSQALFILGVKAVSNFNYDFCKFNFEKLLDNNPSFVMGYWGLAMCSAQLMWDGEDPVTSKTILDRGRAQQQRLGVTLSDREEMYYKAAEALCNITVATFSPATDCRSCRYQAFLRGCQDLFEAYPDDANAAAYVILAQAALGNVVCGSGTCEPIEAARALAKSLHEDARYSKNPAVLHYSLHMFDSPDPSVYKDGIVFAEEYPRLVNGSVHSLHMPAHVYLRAGDFPNAAAADQDSVDASDAFNVGGALTYQDGEVGSMTWAPGSSTPSGMGFSFDAGNTYHSLEYLQYEVLQGCDPRRAGRLTQRMGVAAYQALAAGNSSKATVAGGSVTSLGSAWYGATTYYGWMYRMQARGAQQAVMNALLGSVGELAEDSSSHGMAGTGSLPLPLAWQGATDYNNVKYAPQSEAGLWNAIALDSLLGDGLAVQAVKKALAAAASSNHSADDGHTDAPEHLFQAPCGTLPGMQPCDDVVAYMALQRIREVRDHYLGIGSWYESNLTEAVALQVASALALSNGHLAEALEHAQMASKLELDAIPKMLPSSLSLYFMPGNAYHGILALRVASMAKEMAGRKALLSTRVPGLDMTIQDLLQAAKESFEGCLQSRLNLSVCLLGAARVQAMMPPQNGTTVDYYGTLKAMWNEVEQKPAKKYCDRAWREVMRFAK